MTDPMFELFLEHEMVKGWDEKRQRMYGDLKLVESGDLEEEVFEEEYDMTIDEAWEDLLDETIRDI